MHQSIPLDIYGRQRCSISFEGRFFCFLVVLASDVRADDWPQYRGPKRDGSTSDKVAAWTKETAPKVAWRAEVGNGFACPVVANGKLFVHSHGGDASKEEEDVDASTGEVHSLPGSRPRIATATVSFRRANLLGRGKLSKT